MSGENWRLVFAGGWLVGAGFLYFGKDNVSPLVPMAAVVLAGWNVARWVQRRYSRPTAVRTPLHRREPAEGYEYNPDLDFQKMDREEKDRPT